MSKREDINQLFYDLCDHIGVLPTYQDDTGTMHQISRDTLFAVAKALGITVEDENGIKHYLANTNNTTEEKLMDEVNITWQGRETNILIHANKNLFKNNIYLQIQLENGEILRDIVELTQLRLNNGRYFIPILKSIPLGYHQVYVEIGKRTASTLLIVAPELSTDVDYDKCYGFFAPIYALHSNKTTHYGNLTDFDEFIKWSAKCGASFIGTVPFNAEFFEEKHASDPYAPSSRLFWNEIYLDLTRLPEFSGKHYDKEKDGLVINHKQAQKILRKELLIMAKTCRDTQRINDFAAYVALHPELKDYAKFQAIYDFQKEHRQTWQDDYFHLDTYDYHLYAQWNFATQLNEIKKTVREHNLHLYVDLPMGVKKDGYDVNQYHAQFVEHMSIGIPPDSHFKAGRNCQLAPLNPLSLSKHRFSYFIKTLRTIMPIVDILDIDNVRELQHVFLIPDGMSAEDGAYVKYPRAIFYAILLLEAHRHQVILTSKARQNFPTITSLSRHDSAPFAAFLLGKDIDKQIKHRLLTRRQAAAEKTIRRQQLYDFVKYNQQLRHLEITTEQDGLSKFGELELLFQLLLTAFTLLAKSDEPFLLINIEDLWLETKQQRLPTMNKESFKNKLAYSIEMLDKIPNLSIILALLNQLRPNLVTSKKITT